MPAWAMIHNIVFEWIPDGNYLLTGFGLFILGLQAWMMIEGLLIWPRSKGVLEQALPPLSDKELVKSGGRSC